MIQTDAKGERQFFHWRDSAAARQLMDLPETDELLNSLMSYDIVYLSAITLSIYNAAGRERLFAAIKRARLLGTRFVFDTNFRARGMAGPRRRARGLCTRRSRPPTSCWLRPRICCRSIPARATSS